MTRANTIWRTVCGTLLFILTAFVTRPIWSQDSSKSENNVKIRAAVFRDSGASEMCAFSTLQILNNENDFLAEYVSAKDIQDGKLRDYDVVVFPGGTASGERRALDKTGWKRLIEFLNNGGGYYGTCAGAYLALVNLSREESSLIDAELQEGEWERGEAVLKIELTEEGRELLGGTNELLDVVYQNGPVVHPANYEKLKPYSVIAFFRTEIAENNAPKGVQVNSPAILYGAYGKGRVVISSPHPELTPNLNYFVPRLVKFAAQK